MNRTPTTTTEHSIDHARRIRGIRKWQNDMMLGTSLCRVAAVRRIDTPLSIWRALFVYNTHVRVCMRFIICLMLCECCAYCHVITNK